jgi:CheY-like chemotaxis protein
VRELHGGTVGAESEGEGRGATFTVTLPAEDGGAVTEPAPPARQAMRFHGLRDILVSDIRMPGEDGYTLIRKVRAREAGKGGGVAAVALTAYGRNGPRRGAVGRLPGARRQAGRARSAGGRGGERQRTVATGTDCSTGYRR